ncbi:fasciclin domain-containing protein [Costertonia aggregata]|uniref:Fasciclin domain-containing protein n=1 Tax=Costertonia aggregata TaxID=343403 RepID=A0A7H9AJR0_9FLAO|nr:fasciclin domain-containing protein [Costertonia aggregata]QLG43808.1 fasciclin domain-containing protein [Costertonia aggregata]
MKDLANSPLALALFFCLATICAQSQSDSRTLERSMNPEKSISQNTEASKNHKTLLAAVKAADLEDVLDESGPFTVFAPSDVAFGKIPKDTMKALLLPENKKELHAVLTYHIVAGNLSASSILKAMCRGKGKATFTTVQGDILTATMKGLDIILTDNTGNTAKITQADANQCNGVIHVIDSVILPKRM